MRRMTHPFAHTLLTMLWSGLAASAESPELRFSWEEDGAAALQLVFPKAGEHPESWIVETSLDARTWGEIGAFPEEGGRFILQVAALASESRFFRAVQREPESPEQAWERYLAIWEAAGIERYDMTVEESGFVRQWRGIFAVQDGEVLNADTLLMIPDDGLPAEQLSVEDLFAKIEDALDRDAHLVDVSYDPILGFPRSVFIDLSELIIDEEFSFEVLSVTPEAEFSELLRKHRLQWEAQARPDYQVEVECRGPWKFWAGTLAVAGGEIRDLTVADGDVLAGDELPPDARTIDDLFDLIEAVLLEDRLLYARYDETTGHPRVIKIDWPDLAHDGGGPLFELGEIEPLTAP